MYNLKGALLLDSSICGTTVRAEDDFPGSTVNSFAETLASQIFEAWVTKALEKEASFGFGEHDTCTGLMEREEGLTVGNYDTPCRSVGG